MEEALAAPALRLLHAHRLQLRVGEAGVRDQALDRRPRLLQLPVEAQPELEVGELRLPVSLPGAVGALEVGVLGVHGPAHVVGGAGHSDDPRRIRLQQRGHQQRGQRPVAEVVGTELHLVTVGGLALRDPHHTGVVDQQVDAVVGRQDLLRGRLDRGLVSQVQLDELQRCVGVGSLDVLDRGLRLLLVAGRHHDVGAGGGQGTGSLEPEASVGARSDRCAALEVADVGGGPAHAPASLAD